jgi:hypothetical protein
MVTYTLTVTNNGPVEAADVVMDDTVPAELTGHLVRVHTDWAGPDLPGRHACGRGSDPPSPGRVGDWRLRHCNTATKETNVANNASCVQTLISTEQEVPVTG